MTGSPVECPVSALLAVRNGEDYVAEALESICSQTVPPEEVIVIDGGSDDRTVEIASSFPGVEVVAQKGTGIPDAYNQGLEESSGKLVAFQSHDDRWEPKKLSLQVAFMAENPDVAISFTQFRFFVEPGAPLPPTFNPGLLDRDLVGMIPETMVARREVFDTVGLFDTDYQVAHDVDWLARARDMDIRMEVLPEILLRKRVHSSNTSADAELNTPLLMRTLRESIQRKRERKAPRDPGRGG